MTDTDGKPGGLLVNLAAMSPLDIGVELAAGAGATETDLLHIVDPPVVGVVVLDRLDHRVLVPILIQKLREGPIQIFTSTNPNKQMYLTIHQ